MHQIHIDAASAVCCTCLMTLLDCEGPQPSCIKKNTGRRSISPLKLASLDTCHSKEMQVRPVIFSINLYSLQMNYVYKFKRHIFLLLLFSAEYILYKCFIWGAVIKRPGCMLCGNVLVVKCVQVYHITPALQTFLL